MAIRVLIADDQEMVRTGFRTIVDSQPGMEVVGEAADGSGAVTTFDMDEYVYGALRGGAVGFLSRTAVPRCSWRPSGRTDRHDRDGPHDWDD